MNFVSPEVKLVSLGKARLSRSATLALFSCSGTYDGSRAMVRLSPAFGLDAQWWFEDPGVARQVYEEWAATGKRPGDIEKVAKRVGGVHILAMW